MIDPADEVLIDIDVRGNRLCGACGQALGDGSPHRLRDCFQYVLRQLEDHEQREWERRMGDDL